MNFDFKKAVCIAMSTVMVACFAGCGGGSENSQSSEAVSGTVSDNSSDKTAEFVDKKYDLNGRTITVWAESNVPKKGSLLYESLQETMKNFNCKFNWVAKSDYTTTIETLTSEHLAGKPSFDVVQVRSTTLAPILAASGTLLAMDEVYDFNNDPTWQHEWVKDKGNWKGHKYGIYAQAQEPGYAIFYNKALFRKFNVKDPWEYVENNEWNFDTFRSVCKQLTKDTNGDGENDYWAFTSEDPWLDFIMANDAHVVNMDEKKGTAKVELDSKASIDAIQYVADLFNVDNVIPDGAEAAKIADTVFNAMFTGKVAMFPYQVRYGAVMVKQGIAAEDVGWVYLPKGPNAKDYIIGCRTIGSLWAFPAKIENPEEVVAAWQDAVGYWDESKTTCKPIETGLTELIEDEEMSAYLVGTNKKLLMEGGVKTRLSLADNFGLFELLQTELWVPILKQEQTPKTAVKSLLPKIETKITETCEGVVS